jgi:predicted O-methyltransferase YrrM
MTNFFHGFLALHIYLPLSGLARRWRRFSRRVRGKSDQFLQQTRLHEIAWKDCVGYLTPYLLEIQKENGNVRLSELAILSAFAKQCRPGSSLFEIGTFDGRTSLNLAINAPATCRIITLDLPPNQNTRFELASGERHMVEKPMSGLRYEKYRTIYPEKINRVYQVFGDSATFDYEPYVNSCSLVFVDGSHAYDYAISDTLAAMSIVEPGGIIVWHDYGIWSGVTQALEELESKEKLGLRNIKGTSLVFWKKGIQPQ